MRSEIYKKYIEGGKLAAKALLLRNPLTGVHQYVKIPFNFRIIGADLICNCTETLAAETFQIGTASVSHFDFGDDCEFKTATQVAAGLGVVTANSDDILDYKPGNGLEFCNRTPFWNGADFTMAQKAENTILDITIPTYVATGEIDILIYVMPE